MPGISPRGLADSIQIAASVGVIAGIVFLIVDLAHTRQSMQPERSAQAHDPPSESLRVAPLELIAAITEERQSELHEFVETHCPSCHGTRLTGSIGPALTEAGLQHLSLNAVTMTILHGYAGKGMPAWKTQLSNGDAYWIAQQLKHGSFDE